MTASQAAMKYFKKKGTNLIPTKYNRCSIYVWRKLGNTGWYRKAKG